MRRRLGRLDGGGKSSWRRLGALLHTGVGGLTAAATSGPRFVRVAVGKAWEPDSSRPFGKRIFVLKTFKSYLEFHILGGQV
jgi:hypothetical protein